METPREKRLPSWRTFIEQRNVRAAVLVCLTVLAYLPALRGGFVWDDDTMVTKNPLVHARDGLYRIWFTTEPIDYWPVTYSTLWLEWRLWGDNPLGYHVVNAGLHVAEALLLWRILIRLNVPGSFWGALIFALHPVNVESVAWIAQGKNLIAMLFFLLSILSFISNESRRAAEREPDSHAAAFSYWLSLLFYAAALLSKGSVAMLPIALLGIIVWRRRPTFADLLRVAPFFALSFVFVVVDVWFQHHGSSVPIRTVTPIQRVLGAGAVVWFYLWQALFPAKLIFVYRQWDIQAQNPLWWVPTAAAVAFTIGLWKGRRLWGRAAFFAWIYFCAMLVPVLGLSDVYFMRYSLVADHYEHLALIGVVAYLAAVVTGFARSGAGHIASVAQALVIATPILFFAQTWRLSENYANEETLFRSVLRLNPSCWMAYNNLGGVLTESDRQSEALPLFDESLRLQPNYPEAHYSRGVALFKLHRLGEAIRDYRDALELKPLYPEALYNLGLALAESGDATAAAENYARALEIRPDFAKAHNGIGLLLTQGGNPVGAMPHFKEAIRIEPDSGDFHENLGMALFSSGHPAESIGCFERAIKLKGATAQGRNNLGVAFASVGRTAEAVAQFKGSLQIDPTDASVHRNLAKALGDLGQTAESVNETQEAARLEALPALRP